MCLRRALQSLHLHVIHFHLSRNGRTRPVNRHGTGGYRHAFLLNCTIHTSSSQQYHGRSHNQSLRGGQKSHRSCRWQIDFDVQHRYRSKTSGSIYAQTSSPSPCSMITTTSSTKPAKLGTSSPTIHLVSLPSPHGPGPRSVLKAVGITGATLKERTQERRRPRACVAAEVARFMRGRAGPRSGGRT